MFATPKATSGRPSLGGQSFLNASIQSRRSVQTTPRSTPTATKRGGLVGQILEETVDYVVTALNAPVPVQVQETLKVTGGGCAVRLDKSGWAWLVADSKLLIWRYSSQQVTAQCMVVTLPQCKTTWSTETIAVATQASELLVTLLAVSPEGKAYYWSNVLRDTSILCEERISLGEGGVATLKPLSQSNGFLLCTESANLYLVTLVENQLVVKEVPLPGSVLSGLSKRVSSLFFGGGVTSSQEVRGVVCGERGMVLVLTNTHLQHWRHSGSKMELVYNIELKPIISDSVCLNQWAESDLSTNQIAVWLVDVQLAGNNVVVLFAVVLEGSTNAEYGLIVFPSQEEPAPDVDNLYRLNYTVSYNASSADSALLRYSLLGCRHTLAVYGLHTALLVNLSKPGLPDMVSFPQPNVILGAGHTPSHDALFTLHHGVVSIAPHTVTASRLPHPLTTPSRRRTVLTTPILSPSPLVRKGPVMAPEVSNEATEVLKTAFAEYLEGNMAEVEALCEEHFPTALFSSGLDTPGDVGVINLSTLIVDDRPVTSDPSWGEGAETPTRGKSLILIYRLEQKLLAHNRYLRFLADSGLLDRLTAVTVRGRGQDTRQVLCEHAEKIQAAISVRKIHNGMIDELIRLAVRGRSSSPLSKTEQFYTQLSLFDSLLTALPTLHKDLSGLHSSQQRVDHILSTSSLLLTVLTDAILYRRNNVHMYQIPDTPRDYTQTMPTCEIMYWTSSDETRSVIREEVELLLSVCVSECGEEEQAQVGSLVAGLADILFDGFKIHIDSLPAESVQRTEVQRSFEADRTKILTGLMRAGHTAHATELAEKYGDFRVLVQLCEGMGDVRRVREYMATYKEQGFAEFLFKWYLDEGKLKQLLSFSESFPRELSTFLSPHPHLHWLHSLSVKDYDQAYNDLTKLAEREVNCVAKKKTLLSLSKLSLLADSGGKADTAQLDSALSHIQFQQSIPKDTLEDAGLDPVLMRPLPTQDIVELYVGGEAQRGDEERFIAALALIEQTYPEGSPEGNELKCHVWSQAILRDDWTQLNTDDPLKELQKTFFSSLIVEGYNQALDMLSLLPQLAHLLSYETLVSRGVASEPVFKYMIRAGYEQLERVYANRGTEQEEQQPMDNV